MSDTGPVVLWSILGVSGVLFHFYLIFDKKFLHANSVDPDQTLRSAATDLVYTFCLP